MVASQYQLKLARPFEITDNTFGSVPVNRPVTVEVSAQLLDGMRNVWSGTNSEIHKRSDE
jgi:hypothetical protein